MKQFKNISERYYIDLLPRIREKTAVITNLHPSLHIKLSKEIFFTTDRGKLTKYAAKDSLLSKRSKENIRNKDFYCLLSSLIITPINYYDIFARGEQFQSCVSLDIRFDYGQIKWIDLTLIKFMRHIKGFCFLQKLNIFVNRYGGFMAKNIQTLFEAVKYSPSLKDFSFELKECRQLNDNNLFQIARLLRKLNHIEKLNITLPNHGQLSVEAIGAISQSIPFKSDDLTINLQNYLTRLNFTAVDALNFKDSFQRFESLTVFDNLDFGYSWEGEVGNMDIDEFDYIIKSLKLFKRVSLWIYKYDKIKIEASLTKFSKRRSPSYFKLDISNAEANITIVNMILEAMKNFDLMEELVFDFSETTRIYDKQIIGISALLDNFKILKHFTLKCNICSRLSAVSLESIGKSLAKNPLLKSLSLDFSNCRVTKISMRPLLISLHSLVNLERLQILLDGIDEKMKLIVDPRTLENVQSLDDLIFNMNYRIWCRNNLLTISLEKDNIFGDEDAVLLASLIRNKWKVSDIDFKMRAETLFLTKAGIDTIIKSFCQFQILTNLTIHFQNCLLITGENFKTLAIWIGKLSFLVNLDLNFSGCTQIKDEGILALSDSIRELDQLETCSFHFSKCNLITEKSVNPLLDTLVHKKLLDVISFYCSSITLKSNQDLRFKCSSEMCSSKDFSLLCEVLKRIPTPLNLEVISDSCKMHSAELSKVLADYFPKIKTVGFSYQCCFKYLKENNKVNVYSMQIENHLEGDMKNFLDLILPDPNSVEIYFEFDNYSKIDSSVFDHMCKVIKSSKDMTALKLRLNVPLSKEEVFKLRECCSNLINLQLFTLHLVNESIEANRLGFIISNKSTKKFQDYYNGDEDLITLSSFYDLIKGYSTLRINLARLRDVTNDGIETLCKKFPTHRELRHISVNLDEVKNIEPSTFKTIAGYMKDCKTLDSINFAFSHLIFTKSASTVTIKVKEKSFNDRFVLEDTDFKGITQFLESFSDISKLNLDLNECDKMEDSDCVEIFRCLKKLKLLSELNFMITKCPLLTEKIIDNFEENLKQCDSLKNLTFAIYSSNVITQNSLKILSILFSSLKSLQSFTFFPINQKIEGNSKFLTFEMTNCTFFSQIIDFLGFYSSLSGLNITTRGIKAINDEDFKNLAKNLKLIPNLNNLLLDFPVLGLKDDLELSEMLKVFANFKNLHILKLNLPGCKQITNQVVSSLMNSIHEMSQLSELHLTLSSSTLSDEGMNIISKSISNLKNLTKLDLKCTDCTLSEDVLSAFSLHLLDLPKLRETKLRFYGFYIDQIDLSVEIQALSGKQISNQELNFISKLLANMKNTENLTVTFLGSSHSFNDVGIGYICDAIESLSILKYLKLRICNSSLVSDAALLNLSHSINKVKSLKNISIDFRMSQLITKGGVDTFKQSIDNSIVLDFQYGIQFLYDKYKI